MIPGGAGAQHKWGAERMLWSKGEITTSCINGAFQVSIPLGICAFQVDMSLGIGAFQADIPSIPLAISAFQLSTFLSIGAFQVSRSS